MKSKLLLSALCLALLNSTPQLFAEEQITEEQAEGQIYLSAVEVQEIFDHPDRSYVYLGKQVSAIPQVIAEINKLDNNKESLVWLLEDHMNKGFVIGYHEGVLQALEQAQVILQNHTDDSEKEIVAVLSGSLTEIIENVAAHNLSLDAEKLAFLKDSLAASNDINADQEITA